MSREGEKALHTYYERDVLWEEEKEEGSEGKMKFFYFCYEKLNLFTNSKTYL